MEASQQRNPASGRPRLSVVTPHRGRPTSASLSVFQLQNSVALYSTAPGMLGPPEGAYHSLFGLRRWQKEVRLCRVHRVVKQRPESWALTNTVPGQPLPPDHHVIQTQKSCFSELCPTILQGEMTELAWWEWGWGVNVSQSQSSSNSRPCVMATG